MRVLWDAGLQVPHLVGHTENHFDKPYFDEDDGAAPQLAQDLFGRTLALP